MRFFKDFKDTLLDFGLNTAIKLILLPRIARHIGYKKDLYIPTLLNWQKKIIKPIIEKYKDFESIEKFLPDNYIIWTCWWQGEDQMPDVVRECYDSLKRNISFNQELKLITKDNFSDYIEIPKFIIDKLNTNKICLSHFSDIIRSALLAKYGGGWIDIALYVIKPIANHRTLFSSRVCIENSSICQGKWTVGCFFAPKGHKLFLYMYDCLIQYWKTKNKAIDYLMMDGFLRIACQEFPDIGKEIESFKISSPNLHESRYSFGDKVNMDKFHYLISHNEFLSLTWRLHYPKNLPSGELTYYGALLNQFQTNDIN